MPLPYYNYVHHQSANLYLTYIFNTSDQKICLDYKHSDSICQKTSSRRCLCTVLWVCVFMCACVIKSFSNNWNNALQLMTEYWKSVLRTFIKFGWVF